LPNVDERIDSLVSGAFSTPDTFHPRVPVVAGNDAAFAAMCRRSGWFEAVFRAESGDGLLQLFADLVETIRF
jgi:hypothetical protein